MADYNNNHVAYRGHFLFDAYNMLNIHSINSRQSKTIKLKEIRGKAKDRLSPALPSNRMCSFASFCFAKALPTPIPAHDFPMFFTLGVCRTSPIFKD